ncbi:MAG: ThuA domain-containing protein [Anaerolineae bacterium]|nr:ThuA domain-containing protein [Anaerolineae bacterium]
MQELNVTIWNEFRHEKSDERVKEFYPDGMHAVIGQAMENHGFRVRAATLDEPDHGLTDAVLAQTDVLLWWGHKAHNEVQDNIVERVYRQVMAGMGLVVLHSGHYSKIFKKLMGTTCSLRWREAGERERIWVINPGHPIAAGLDHYFDIPATEMYGEHFDIPTPDELVFISWFEGGEVFRSGCCFYRGNGKIFYFRPGHETHPIYHQAEVQQVIANGVRWAAPINGPAYRYGNK